MEERPADMEGSCEYIDYAVADSRQGVVSSLGVGEVLTTQVKKINHVTKYRTNGGEVHTGL